MSEPRVIFVCWGNICRSPMGERVARRAFADAHLAASLSSAGVSDEERGHPIDRRAARVLAAHGYDAAGHRAHQITRAEIDAADLIVAFEPLHVERMLRLAPDAANIALLTDFIPNSTTDTVDDPWYGGIEGFETTLELVEAAMPAIVERARHL